MHVVADGAEVEAQADRDSELFNRGQVNQGGLEVAPIAEKAKTATLANAGLAKGKRIRW